MMYELDNLKYRRQFLLSPQKCEALKDWKIENVDTYHLYVHPDCTLNKIKVSNIELFLIGNIINPYYPEKKSDQILEDISNFESVDDISKILYPLVGRFVLFIKSNDKILVYNDACGLKTVYYSLVGGALYVASQPLLLGLVVDLIKNPNYDEYFTSHYVRSNVEHWMPSGVTLFEGVRQLKPNHYFDSSTQEQIRYWPLKQIEKKSIDESVDKIAFLLKNTMVAAKKRFLLALPLTAGVDSRMLLSSCREFIHDVFVYTLQYRDLTDNSSDIRIPRQLSEHLGFEHKTIDCRGPSNVDYVNVYSQNTDNPHLNDWCNITNRMNPQYPKDRVQIKGSCVEIGRCAYYHKGRHPKIKSSYQFVRLINGWDEIDFIKNRISNWYDEVKDFDLKYGYDLYDLFYWEHRIGSWQAQSQLEWDIVHEQFTPFNNREIIDSMLAVNPKYRARPKSMLFTKIKQVLWPEVLNKPINPCSVQKIMKNYTKDMLVSRGLYFGKFQHIVHLLKSVTPY